MNAQAIKNGFLESAKKWVCGSYSLSIFYLAVREGGQNKIVNASLILRPLPPEKSSNFSIEAGNLLAGQMMFSSLSIDEVLVRLEAASRGEIAIQGESLYLSKQTELEYFSDQSHKDTWFADLHLQVNGDRLNPISTTESSRIDTALRNATPPFDGMHDLGIWIGLDDRRINGRESTINIRIGPPVDMLFEQSAVCGNQFTLGFNAHPKFDISNTRVSIREFPGEGLEARRQVGSAISWKRPKNGYRSGVLKATLSNADSVLAMLTLGDQTVRRQWFTDPDKALNIRYMATQFFDKELKLLRQTLVDSTDSVKFEKAISSLLYLMGFSNAIQVETQAPDILVSSPGGKLAIIECTTKIADFQNKLGKLVDRRNALVASLGTTGNVHRVDAFLVCGLPRTQIAAVDKQLIDHQVTLLCREDIAQALLHLRTPISPDEMLDRAASRRAQARNVLDH